MIKIENHEVVGWEHAIRGMRNPKNSWGKMDSDVCVYSTDDVTAHCATCPHVKWCHGDDVDLYTNYIIGPNDHDLMMRLAKGGSVHAKYRRMIVVYVDITAPLYWWKEFDTYKVGTVSNSCSTMHKIADKEFTLDDFSHEHLVDFYKICIDKDAFDGPKGPDDILYDTINMLNLCRERYLTALKTEDETGLSAKDIWWQMIQLLPSSYNQKRTIMLNYEVLTGMYRDRRGHKLDEWREFCKWIEELPYSEIITGGKKNDAEN